MKFYNKHFIFTDSPRRWYVLHWVSWLMATVGVLMVLIAHGHYTIDVIIAYLVTTRLFWIYHTLANNVYLKVYIMIVIINNNKKKICY